VQGTNGTERAAWFWWRDYGVFVAVFVVPLVVLTGAMLATGREPRADLVFANGDEPETLDPAQVTSLAAGRIVYALFEGLTVYDPRTRHIVPGVAERWDVDQRGRRYTFHLRDCAWSDGRAVTAEDFVWSWRRVVDPATGAGYAGFLDCIEGAADVSAGRAEPETLGVRALDERVLEVRLVAPTPYFPQLAAFMTFLPVRRDCVERWGRRWTRPEHIISNGAFVLERWEIARRLILARNPRYHAREDVELARVEVLTVPDRNTQLNFYLTGVSDLMIGVPPALIPALSDRPDFHVCPSWETYFYRFNVSRPDSPLADRRVRRALHLAIDREKIRQFVTRGGEQPALALVPPGVPGYAGAKGVPEDRAEANRLLDEAGFRDRSTFPTLTLLFNTSGFHRSIAEVVQDMWQTNLGIRIELRNMEFRTFLARCRALDYEISRGGWSGDYMEPSTFLDCFKSGSGNNRTGWSNAEYDRLLESAALARDDSERFARYARAEKLLVEDAFPITPIYHGVNQRMWKPHVRGMTADPLGLVMLRFISVGTPGN
jgi:oligopeptide transport system substrate-binding protein